MKTPLGIYNLWHQRSKTLVSVGGVAFALLLVFMQLGFMGAVSHTATNVLEHLRFDILIRARDYLHLYEPGRFERSWLSVAASTDGVSKASSFWITLHNWRKLPTLAERNSGQFETQYLPIAVMALQPEDPVFDLPLVISQQARLHDANNMLIDINTQADYGPLNGRRFGPQDVGRRTEVGGQTFTIAGLFDLGTGLAANGAVLVSQQGFSRIVPWNARRQVSLGLLQLQPQQNADELAAVLRERFKLDPNASETAAVEVLTRAEALQRERFRWLWQTPIGLIFQLGVALSLLVGAAIVYMVLTTDVASRISEYATLLAMGYSRRYLASVVLSQAIVLWFCGYVVATLAAEVLYQLTSTASGIPISMNVSRILAVGLLGLVMCWISGLLALRKLWKAARQSLLIMGVP